MTRYIFDTSSLSELSRFYPSRFPTLWENIDEIINNEIIYSIKEVKRELEANSKNYFDLYKRKNVNVPFYENLLEEDFVIVTDLLSVKSNRELVHKKSINKGTPCADPFLIAKAESSKSVLVTQEHLVQDAINIPSICGNRGIRCINLEQFMEEQKWLF